MLAIDAQGRKITTVESLEQNGKLHPVQQAFVDNDAQQCGFCTPGFVMACKAFLDKTPNPTPEQVERGLGGNLCRCGTYVGVRAAVAQAAKQFRREEDDAMADYKWPEAEKRTHIGKRISRIDGPDKVSGKAKYTFDINRPGMLFGKIVRSPYAHAKIVSIDIGAAEKMPGVKAVKIIQGPGTEIKWAGDEIVALAAVDEGTAEDAARAVKIVWERLPHVVNDLDLAKVPKESVNQAADGVTGDPDKGFTEAKTVVEGIYGNAVITHCCLESHGQIAEWTDNENVLLHPSTQSVSSVGNQLAQSLKIPAGNVRVKMDHIGGGFGSKFQIDRWGVECANLSQVVRAASPSS